MSEQENVRTVEKLFENLNAHDLSREKELYAPGYSAENPGAPGPLNYEQSIGYLQGFLTAFPDLHFTLRHTISQGDFVSVTWTATGTHTGPLPTPSGNTIPPTNRKGVNSGSTTYEFKNGKAVASWTYWDMAALLAQLGLMPAM